MSFNCSLLQFLKMIAEKHYEYPLLLLPGMCQINLIDLGFTFAFLSRISVFKFHCHIFLIYYTILPNLAHTITFRFCQTHPVDYNKILPSPPRQLQSDFCQTHPDDYNQIFATPTQTITIRFLPNPPRRLQSYFVKPTQRNTVRFLLGLKPI